MNPVASRPDGPAQENDWKDMFRQWDIIPFLSVHGMCLWAFQTGIKPEWLLLAIGSSDVRMVGVTAGDHRYFAHRSYKTSRVFQFLLAFLAMTSAQKGVLWWAAHHRHHHKYSDREEDFHSPLQRGFWFSHVGWTLSEKHMRADLSLIKDFAQYPEICFLNRFYFIPPALYGLLIYMLWGFPGLIWGFFISTTALYHCTFFINSLTHMVGRVRYRSGDGSRNSFILAILCCGEGWHNNHHHFMSSARLGFRWYEIDIGYYILRVLAVPRLVWGLRPVPVAKLAAT